MKNYIGFVNDHSGSMGHLAQAAMNDYNSHITTIKQAATQEMLDTVVSVVGVGFPNGHHVTRQVQISNPHVLKPVNHWAVYGGTPLYDGIASMINLLKDLPDADDSNVSFLVMITTDGEECSSRFHNRNSITKLIAEVSRNGQWTFVFRVPRCADKKAIMSLGIPAGNIQEWETTAEGMANSTKVTAQAMTNYFTSRSAGARSTGSFYADASQVNLAKLEELPAVTPTSKPTKSPIPVTPRVLRFETREEAHNHCRVHGIDQTRIKDNGKGSVKGTRWTI